MIFLGAANPINHTMRSGTPFLGMLYGGCNSPRTKKVSFDNLIVQLCTFRFD